MACGGDDHATAPPNSNLTVFAAASLTEAFAQLGKDFEAEHRGARVVFNFAASSALVTQINQGAPADVFASADEASMQKVVGAGPPAVFARNKLAIIVGKGNPKKIASLGDLASPNLIVVTAAPQVPAGAYAAQVLQKAGVVLTPKSYEADVKAVVTKVASGEADAGLVYRTDVQAAAAKAEGVAIPDDLNVLAAYPIVVTKAAANPATAQAFVAYVTGPQGQATLATFGFTAPT